MTEERLLERTQIREPKKLATLRRLVERDGGANCRYCGGESDLTIDHVHPEGGEDDANLQILCRGCNSSKGSTVGEKSVRWASSIWQNGFTMVPNVVLLSASLSVGAHRIYSLFLYYARQDEGCWPGQEGLAGVSGMGERSVRSAIRELERAKLVRTRQRGLGLTNLYVLLEPRGSGTAKSAVPEPHSPADPERPEMPIPREKKTQNEEEEVRIVATAWASLSPPLITHREPYLASPRTRSAIKAALRVYPAADVAKAIENYSTVLASNDYIWSYRWTLIDFLRRGLDRFVPEADPLGNFRARGQTKPTGADFSQIDDL